ncbi:SMI1/KNR4 family protein [Pedobacter sp. UYP1]|uniref:SMI1/KNR4 family protein n=1 Tax=Pedobacter sp. UYP1 TaxID=1756396 RepID=UPI00339425A9
MEIERFGEGDIKTIEELEEKSDIKLPYDYKNFLIKNNGARVNDGIFHVKALDEDILLHIFFGTKLEKKALNLEFWNQEYGDEIPENSLLIGRDPGGAFILLIFDGENDGVYFYDHAFAFDQSYEDENTYFIAQSFESFLYLLE